MVNTDLLKPGDCLLYRPAGLFGTIITIKTWHAISHVEVYSGAGFSWASRDGIGVNNYPVRLDHLAYVLRPTAALDLGVANLWANSVQGTPYGWLDLLNFVGLPIQTSGMFCSEFEVAYYRRAGWDMFPLDPPRKVAPFENLNLVGAGFAVAWTNQD